MRDDKLKPCPLPNCGGEASEDVLITGCLVCGFECRCDDWNRLPRRDSTAAEIAQEMEDCHVSGSAFPDWIARLRTIGGAAPAAVWVSHVGTATDNHIQVFADEQRAMEAHNPATEFYGEYEVQGTIGGAEFWESEARDLAAQASRNLTRAEKAEAADFAKALLITRLRRALKNTVQRWREMKKRFVNTSSAMDDRCYELDRTYRTIERVKMERDETTARLAALEAAVATVCGEMARMATEWNGWGIEGFLRGLVAALRSATKVAGTAAAAPASVWVVKWNRASNLCVEVFADETSAQSRADVINGAMCRAEVAHLPVIGATPPVPTTVSAEVWACLMNGIGVVHGIYAKEEDAKSRIQEPGSGLHLKRYPVIGTPPPSVHSGPSELLERILECHTDDDTDATVDALVCWVERHEQEQKK